MITSGEPISAEEAVVLGLADYYIKSEKIDNFLKSIENLSELV